MKNKKITEKLILNNEKADKKKKNNDGSPDIKIKDLFNISMIDKYLKEHIMKNILIGIAVFIASIIISVITQDITYIEVGALIGFGMIAYHVYLIISCNSGNIYSFQGICLSTESVKKMRKSIIIENDYKEQFIIYIDPSKVKQMKRGAYVKCYANKNAAHPINENQFTINSYILVKVIGQPSGLTDK